MQARQGQWKGKMLIAALLVASTAAHAEGWKLVWSDEFNGAKNALPDATKWTYDVGDKGFGNPEIELYCAPGQLLPGCAATKRNAWQDGHGHLVIEARRNAAGRWTSARLKTQGLYTVQFGRIEARMKLPVGDGFWPAFWLLGADIDTVGWPRCGEEDVMEWVQSYGAGTTSSTTHGPGYSGGHGIGAKYSFPARQRVDDGFHTYGLLWSKDRLEYYRDDPTHIFLTVTPASLPQGAPWVYDHPFFLLLNLAIGSGGFPGATDASTPPTARALVDYVRVYQQQ